MSKQTKTEFEKIRKLLLKNIIKTDKDITKMIKEFRADKQVTAEKKIDAILKKVDIYNMLVQISEEIVHCNFRYAIKQTERDFYMQCLHNLTEYPYLLKKDIILRLSNSDKNS